MIRKISATILGISAAVIDQALAHPGHGAVELQNSALHWLDPLHLGTGVSLLIAGIAAIGIFRNYRNRREER